MGGFAGLFTGSNPTLDKMTNQASQVAGFGTQLGEKDVKGASDFTNAILSGDPKAIMSMLGPQVAAAQQQGQQQKQTAAQFGNRSGGTNAGNQMMDDNTRALIQNMIANLTGQAVNTEATLGQNALNTGLQANQQAVADSQMQMQNIMNSLLGKGLSQGMQFGETAGLGALGGALPGGAGAAQGMQGALSSFFG